MGVGQVSSGAGVMGNGLQAPPGGSVSPLGLPGQQSSAIAAGTPGGSATVAAVAGATGSGAGQMTSSLAGVGTSQATPGLAGSSAGPTAAGTSGTSATASSLSGEDTFLKLLVAQMSNQDPTQPMDDQSFITELAQFNTVEQMLNLTQTVNTELGAEQATEAVALLGKSITYAVPGVGQASPTSSQGTVSGVSLTNGQVEVQIGSQSIPLGEVTAVSTSD